MVPVGDGVHLQTVILTPSNQTGPLPILLRRTPYGVPAGPVAQVPTTLRQFAADGYIMVIRISGAFQVGGVSN
jgi:predicted acyl esterase